MTQQEFIKFSWKLLSKHSGQDFDVLWAIAVHQDGLWRWSFRAKLMASVAKQFK